MSRQRATLPIADAATDAPVRVLIETDTESEIRFGAVPARDVPAAPELTLTTDGGDANRGASPNLRQRTFRLRRAVADILVMALIAVAAFAIWPVRLGGGTSYIIIKGTSMEPKFHTGDLAVLRAQDSYRKGDIVAYRIPGGSAGAGHLVIHRIIGHSHGGYLMQGDNRKTPDSWYPKTTDVLGKFRLLVPLPGIKFWALMPWVCCAAIGLAVMWILWPRRPGSNPIEPEDVDSPTSPVGGALTEAGGSAPVPVGQRRLRRLEQDAQRREQHPGPQRRASFRSKQHART